MRTILVTGASGNVGRPLVAALTAAAATERPAPVSEEVRRILGRPAITFRQWARDHAEAFRSGPIPAVAQVRR